jgi:hypothetical protein
VIINQGATAQQTIILFSMAFSHGGDSQHHDIIEEGKKRSKNISMKYIDFFWGI